MSSPTRLRSWSRGEAWVSSSGGSRISERGVQTCGQSPPAPKGQRRFTGWRSLARGVWGHGPPGKFLKMGTLRYNLVRS